MKVYYLISIVSPLILLFWLLHLQKKEPYPKGEILIMLAWGCWSAFAVGIALWLLDKAAVVKIIVDSGRFAALFWDNILTAAIPEELVKLIIALFMVKRNKGRNVMLHAAMCCSIVAIGFQIVENIMYALDGELTTSIVRAVVPFHFTYGSLMGFFLGRAITTGKKHYRFLALLIPVTVHGFFDLIIGLIDLSDWFILVFVLYYIFMLELTGLMVVVITIMSEEGKT